MDLGYEWGRLGRGTGCLVASRGSSSESMVDRQGLHESDLFLDCLCQNERTTVCLSRCRCNTAREGLLITCFLLESTFVSGETTVQPSLLSRLKHT
jgi:hypothetical protein